MSTIASVAASEWANGPRILPEGPVRLTPKSLEHLLDTVIPQVDQITEMLGLKRQRFELSIANLGISSQAGRSAIVSDFSADLPLFLAMVASTLALESVPTNVVATGHIGSVLGDIKPVGGLKAKLKAAKSINSVTIVLVPAADSDLGRLMPKKTDELEAAKKTSDIQVVEVQSTLDAIRQTFDEYTILLGSLRRDFFNQILPISADITSSIASHFSSRSDANVFEQLRTLLESGQCERARTLLSEFILYYSRQSTYPIAIGSRLRNILLSLPDATVRHKIQWPLVDETIIQALKLLSDRTPEDFTLFHHITRGNFPTRPHLRQESAEVILDTLLSSISEPKLVEIADRHVNQTRLSFHPASLTVEAPAELIHVVTQFYLHMGGMDTPISKAEDAAMEALEAAYSREGGYQAALSEATYGPRGGLRHVLDRIAEHEIEALRSKYVRSQLHRCITPLDYDGRIALVEAAQKRLVDWIPHDLKEQAPEHFANYLLEFLQPIVLNIASYRRTLSQM